MDRENRGLTVAQTGLGRKQQLLHDQTALRRGIRAVVERRERNLCTCTRVHSVQIVNQRFHRLIGALACLLIRVLAGKLHALCNRLFVERLGKCLRHRFIIAVAACQTSPLAGLLLDTLGQRTRIDLVVVVLTEHLEGLGEIVAEQLAEGLAHTRRHRIIEVRHALTAMLVILIRLDSNACQRRVRTDVVRLTQEAVAGGKTVAEQLQQVNLTAGGGQRQKIQIVDVDITLAVRLGVRRIEDEHLVELLGTLGAVLEHGAHRGITVDIGVLALDVVLKRGLERQILIHLHQTGVHLTHAGALVAVQDVLLGRAGMSAFNQNLLNSVLHLFNGGSFGSSSLLQRFFDLLCQLLRHIVILAAGGLCCAENCICDLVDLKGSHAPVPLDDLLNHKEKSLSHTKTA